MHTLKHDRSYALEQEKPENKGACGRTPPYFRYIFTNCVSPNIRQHPPVINQMGVVLLNSQELPT